LAYFSTLKERAAAARAAPLFSASPSTCGNSFCSWRRLAEAETRQGFGSGHREDELEPAVAGISSGARAEAERIAAVGSGGRYGAHRPVIGDDQNSDLASGNIRNRSVQPFSGWPAHNDEAASSSFGWAAGVFRS
jgi:hypothetical protein